MVYLAPFLGVGAAGRVDDLVAVLEVSLDLLLRQAELAVLVLHEDLAGVGEEPVGGASLESPARLVPQSRNTSSPASK